MKVCENIRKIRKEKGLTLKQLATKVGVSEQAISHYERGDRKIKTEMLSKIATALDVTTSELMLDELIIDEPYLNREANKEYYKNITDNDIIALLKPIGLIDDNPKTLSSKEKEDLIESLSNINPVYLKVNNYFKNFDNFTKEDLIDVCNEVLNYSAILAFNMVNSNSDKLTADYNELVNTYNKLLELSNEQKNYINFLEK